MSEEFNTTFNSTYSSNSSSGNSTFFDSAEQPEIKKISVYTPIIYVAIILTTFVIFAKVYRQKNLNKLSHTRPFFPPNIQKQLFYELLNAEPRPNENVLRAALLRWASETIRRTIKLKESEPFMTKMYQDGSIGDDLWTRFTISQKLEELEIQQVVKEVESLKKGWAPKFFPLLQDLTFNEALKRRVLAIDNLKIEQLKQWGIKTEDLAKKLSERPKITLTVQS